MMSPENPADETADAYRKGRRDGLGIAALLVSLISFLALLGAEKAILAIVLGAVAMREATQRSLARRLGIVSIVLGALFIVTVAVVLVVFREQFLQLIAALKKLS